jgi:diguanylate cyclase (GGDEF)-like protein/PAS domain S-box-containing protein
MRLSPAARISMGLIALAVSLVLIADLLVGFLPDEARWTEKSELHAAESLAIQAGVIADNAEALGRTLRAVASRDPALLSVGLRSADGILIAAGGEHEKHWRPLVNEKFEKGRYSIPMYRNAEHWGSMEVVFRSALQSPWYFQLRSPSVQVAGVLVTIGLLAYFLYLRRVLQHLDPSSVVPERVRLAFDILTEGVMVLDGSGRVVLVNHAFEQIVPKDEPVIGRRPSELRWLTSNMDKSVDLHPWSRAARERRPVIGDAIEIPMRDGTQRRVIVNCAPILDAKSVARGCLVTIDDVTALDRANQELIKAVQNLNASQKEIERQNVELKRLATRDPMTGCFNRRAFFETAENLFMQAQTQQGELCCVMCDIDHFKRFNDQFGHSVGDQVIISVAKTIGGGLRSFDLLCRYGGEEFCILLPNTVPRQALEIAERIRVAIEQTAGTTVRTMEGLRITSSFGVATLRDAASDLAGLIDQADEALYFAKQNGRNQITIWRQAEAISLEKTIVTVAGH